MKTYNNELKYETKAFLEDPELTEKSNIKETTIRTLA